VGSRPEHRTTPRGGEDRRKHYRREVRWWGQIEVGTDRFACTVLELSRSGARVRVGEREIAMEPVKLEMPPFGDFRGKVVWSSDGVVGIEFAAEEDHRVAKLIASGLNRLPL
jgi:hypothetical protein